MICRTSLSFRYGEYIFRKIKKYELDSYFALRYKFVVEKYRWVRNCGGEVEYDLYDNCKRTLYFGGFKTSGELIGGVRIITHSEEGFMLHNEFRYLLKGGELPYFDSDCAEITRLVIDNDMVDDANDVALGLFKIMFRWSLRHYINRVVFVTNEAFYRFMKKSYYSLQCLGRGDTDGAGYKNIPVILDISKSMEQLKSKDIKTFQFFHA